MCPKPKFGYFVFWNEILGFCSVMGMKATFYSDFGKWQKKNDVMKTNVNVEYILYHIPSFTLHLRCCIKRLSFLIRHLVVYESEFPFFWSISIVILSYKLWETHTPRARLLFTRAHARAHNAGMHRIANSFWHSHNNLVTAILFK